MAFVLGDIARRAACDFGQMPGQQRKRELLYPIVKGGDGVFIRTLGSSLTDDPPAVHPFIEREQSNPSMRLAVDHGPYKGSPTAISWEKGRMQSCSRCDAQNLTRDFVVLPDDHDQV